MTTGTIISIVILVFSVILFLFHFYLVFFQKKLQKAVENKKLTAAKREEDEKRLQLITQMLLADKQLNAKLEQELKKDEKEPLTFSKQL